MSDKVFAVCWGIYKPPLNFLYFQEYIPFMLDKVLTSKVAIAMEAELWMQITFSLKTQKLKKTTLERGAFVRPWDSNI